MKKLFLFALATLTLFTLAACKTVESTTTTLPNEAPTISGVVAEVEIFEGESWNVLDGVTASDPEDGVLTEDIVVTSIPALTITAGVVTPENTGDYYFTYAVTDSQGEEVEEYTTLTVKPVVSEKEEFINYEFNSGEADLNGFEVGFTSPAEGTYEASKGVLTIDVTNNGDSDWHAKLFKTGLIIEKGNTYKFTVRMKASEVVGMHFIINDAEAGWSPYGGTWNMEVGTDFADYSIEFLANNSSDNTEFLLQFGGNTFDTLTNPEAFELVVDSITVKETPSILEETVHEDDFSTDNAGVFEVGIGETATGSSVIENGELKVSLTENGDADWHAKIFKTGIQIESGATYIFTIRMKASQDVKLHYIINNAEAGWSPYTGSWNLAVGTEYADYTLEFIANEASANAEFLVQFGGDNFDGFTNPAAWDLTVDSINITKAVAATVETVQIDDDFEDGLTDGWAERGTESHLATISNVDNKLQLLINTYPTENNPWNMDLYYATEFDLVTGSMYKIVFDYNTVSDQFYELCFEDSAMDWQIRAGFKNGTLSGEGTLEFTFVASMDITDLYIKFSIGKAADGVTTNTLTLDNVKLYEITGSTEFSEEVTGFDPVGETSWGTYNNNDEGAYGVVYAEDGKLIYEIEAFGATDWFNKLFFEDVQLTGGGLYTIEFTIKADKTVTGLAGLNVTGQWDPRIWESITVTETEQTFSFTMDAMLMFDMNFEILFQFGFPTNEAPTTIEFISVTIFRQE
ncbi:MAG: carbohydrate binding domain-containing protein [Firmicutes bacterium]|nr:carbohydrate binding domain-containing protein [Bacillota bacterium]